jgi:acyl-CoA thioester hydrolase
MNEYIKSVEIRWGDLDSNQHVTHSKYYELGAHTRMSFMLEHGCSLEEMNASNFGPILFREECVFRRELNVGEVVQVNMKLTKARKDGSRWSVLHEIIKPDGALAAVMNADLAWIDVTDRKLTVPALAAALIEKMPRSEGFHWTD